MSIGERKGFAVWHVEDTAMTREQYLALRADNPEIPPSAEMPVSPPASEDQVKLDVHPEAWRKYANCKGVDPSLMLPERGEDTRPAKAVCRACVVIEPCLEDALAKPRLQGVLGGTSERERRRIRRARNVASKNN